MEILSVYIQYKKIINCTKFASNSSIPVQYCKNDMIMKKEKLLKEEVFSKIEYKNPAITALGNIPILKAYHQKN